MNDESELVLVMLSYIMESQSTVLKYRQLCWNVLQYKRKTNLRILKLLLSRQSHIRLQNPIDTIIKDYVDSDFHSHFRMMRQTFFKLVQICLKECNLTKKYSGGNQPLSVEKKILITLWYLAKEGSMGSVAEVFNVARSTVKCVTRDVILELCKLSPKFIAWPSKEDALILAKDFQSRSDFPDVIGAIDGSHFCIKAPLDQQDCYTDRKLNKSIIMQAICTSNFLFTNVNIGYPGRLHDARVFSNSDVFKKIETEGPKSLFYGKYHLLGDLAYTNTSWLITPFKDYGNLTIRHRKFNTKLSKTRVAIEITFGLLKGRWRRLLFIDTNNIKMASIIILATCVLHNFCLLNDDFLDTFIRDENDMVNTHQRVETSRVEIRTGEEKRRDLLNLLIQ